MNCGLIGCLGGVLYVTWGAAERGPLVSDDNRCHLWWLLHEWYTAEAMFPWCKVPWGLVMSFLESIPVFHHIAVLASSIFGVSTYETLFFFCWVLRAEKALVISRCSPDTSSRLVFPAVGVRGGKRRRQRSPGRPPVGLQTASPAVKPAICQRVSPAGRLL